MNGGSACPVCEGARSRPLFRAGGFHIRRCESCDHGFVSPVPTQADLEALYRHEDGESLYASGDARRVAEYLDAAPERFRTHFANRLAWIRRIRTEDDAAILDFGCTNGAFVEALRRSGHPRTRGFDIAEDLVRVGRTRWDADLHAGSLDAFLADLSGCFDVIHSANVFEHLPDPKGTLALLKSALAPGGAVVLSVPNMRSLQVLVSGRRSPIIAPPHHLQYYSPASLRRLVEDQGFEVTWLGTPFWGPETDTYLGQLGCPRWLAKGLRFAMRVPGLAVERLRWGGVVALVGVLRSDGP